MVRADVSGEFRLPFETIFVSIPQADGRAFHVGELLTARAFKA
jgi:hypothetical protein